MLGTVIVIRGESVGCQNKNGVCHIAPLYNRENLGGAMRGRTTQIRIRWFALWQTWALRDSATLDASRMIRTNHFGVRPADGHFRFAEKSKIKKKRIVSDWRDQRADFNPLRRKVVINDTIARVFDRLCNKMIRRSYSSEVGKHWILIFTEARIRVPTCIILFFVT